MSHVPGAGLDLADRIETHLFVVCPNNSGSSFLTAALETCRAAWRLPREGQMIRGFAGPAPWQPQGRERWFPGLLWASEPRWIDLFSDPRRYDWPRTRRAWPLPVVTARFRTRLAAHAQGVVLVRPRPPSARLGVRDQVHASRAARGAVGPPLP